MGIGGGGGRESIELLIRTLAENYYIGKGLREPCSPNRTAYVFGAELNVPNADNWNCLPEIVDPTTTFDLSTITINHEVAVTLANFTNLSSGGRVTFTWYRSRDNKVLYTFNYDIPNPATSWLWYYVYSYLGYVDWEISENGDYYVTISSPWGTQTLNFSVIGIPPLQPGQEFTQEVRVLDLKTSSYITGATVYVEGRMKYGQTAYCDTDSNGLCYFICYVGETYFIRVSKTNYKTEEYNYIASGNPLIVYLTCPQPTAIFSTNAKYCI